MIPILQGVSANDQPAMDAARKKAATVDAQISADALHTILCIGKNRFDDAEKAPLENVDAAALTPLEVIAEPLLFKAKAPPRLDIPGVQ